MRQGAHEGYYIYATVKCHHLRHKQWGPSFFHESRSCTPVIVSSFHGKEKKRKKKSDEHSTRAYACSKVRSSIVCPFCFLILGKEKDARCQYQHDMLRYFCVSARNDGYRGALLGWSHGLGCTKFIGLLVHLFIPTSVNFLYMLTHQGLISYK